MKWWSRVPRVSIRIFIKNDLIFIFAENTLMLAAVSVFQVPSKSTMVFYVKISNALFEEKTTTQWPRLSLENSKTYKVNTPWFSHSNLQTWHHHYWYNLQFNQLHPLVSINSSIISISHIKNPQMCRLLFETKWFIKNHVVCIHFTTINACSEFEMLEWKKMTTMFVAAEVMYSPQH